MTEKGSSASQHNQLDVSARKKALSLGRYIGLSGEEGYRPSMASITARAQQRQNLLVNQYQSNLETIYTIALAQTPSDVIGADLDPDWIHQFFQLAEQIHNRNMQTLWGRILANELTSPGRFSLRSLSTLKQLTHKEAQMFEKALGMSVTVNNESKLKLLMGYRHSGGIGQLFRKSDNTHIALSQFGLPYSAILTMVDAGLLHKSEFETGVLNAKTAISLTLSGKSMTLTPKHGNLQFNYYRLTPSGDELAQLVRSKPDEEYVKALTAIFSKDFKIDY